MLQFITDPTSKRSVEDQIKEVLSAGGNWITIDPTGKSDDEIRALVEKIMPECLEKQAFLILKDRVDLAKEINVGGVLLSQGGEIPSSARMKLGAAAVIGMEVQTFDQAARLQGLDIDYVAMYPYKSEEGTDINPLGLATIREICSAMEAKEVGIPRVAAGGVTYNDIAPLMEAGCNGVAMSGYLANASDISSETARAIALLKQYEKKENETLN